MPTFLFKTEPSEFSFDDLLNAGTSRWDGVSNPQALQNLRLCRAGDHALIYHTGDQKAIVGLARVESDPYQDPKAPGLTPDGQPKAAVVDLRAVRAATPPLTLADIKAHPRFKAFELVTHPRLSVMVVPPALDQIIRKAARL
ncbi:MAG: EVE domain-containing protein [Phycisphaeraceae bacterium]|nr:MAG: EVE domain-containing protein [Phycisphaeraceae bacterium]